MIYISNMYYSDYVEGHVDPQNYTTDMEKIENKKVWGFYYARTTGTKSIKRKPVYGKISRSENLYGPSYKFFPIKKDGTCSKKGAYLYGKVYADTEAEAISEFNRVAMLYIDNYKKMIADTESDML